MNGIFDRYAAFVCDLDGVVYRGPAAVPHAVEALACQEREVLYATNNASRPPADVADHLTRLGLACSAERVVNASQAAAWVLRAHRPAGSTVLAVGGEGVAQALVEAGFRAVHSAGNAVTAVVQGYGPLVTAADLAEASYAVQRGALWVATNTDSTLPTDRGIAPGNGSLVGAVANAVGHPPDLVAGKPETPIYELCTERLGVDDSQVLAIGDRLETDIAGANALGMDSLAVLTGVDDLRSIASASQALRPTMVAADLRCLVLAEHAAMAQQLTGIVRGWWSQLDAGTDPTSLLAGIDQEQIIRSVLPSG